MTPPAGRPIGRTSVSWNRAILPLAVAMMMSSLPVAVSTQASSSFSCEGDRDDPARADLLELLERRLLDDPAAGREDEVGPGLEVAQGDRGHRDLARLDLDAGQVDDRHALGLAARVRDLVDLRAEHPARDS